MQNSAYANLLKVAALGVVTKPPNQKLVINALDDTDFGGKVYFCE